jgi:hypothetical protein
VLGLKNEWALRDYVAAIRNYPPDRVETIIGMLNTFDLRAKGVDNVNTGDEELLRELISRILL